MFKHYSYNLKGKIVEKMFFLFFFGSKKLIGHLLTFYARALWPQKMIFLTILFLPNLLLNYSKSHKISDSSSHTTKMSVKKTKVNI